MAPPKQRGRALLVGDRKDSALEASWLLAASASPSARIGRESANSTRPIGRSLPAAASGDRRAAVS